MRGEPIDVVRVQLVLPDGGIRHLTLTMPRSAAQRFPRVVMARAEEESK